MSNKTIKCNSCGFPLDASSASQNRIKCPKCGSVNVISIPENKDAPNNDDVIKGLPFTEKWSDVHRRIVEKIIKFSENVPSDIFQELKIASAERVIVPCYLFDCKVNFQPIKQVNIDNQSYAVKTQQDAPYTFSVKILRSGSNAYQDVISDLYEHNELTNAVNVEKLHYPSDVTYAPVDNPESNFKDDIEKNLVDLASSQAKTLIESGYYPSLSGNKHNFNINYQYESHQINLPLIHVTFTYKSQRGEFYLSGDAKKIIAINLPADSPLRRQFKQLDDSYKNDIARSGFGCALLFWGGIPTLASLYMFYANWSIYFPLALLLIGVPTIVYGIYYVNKGAESIKQEQEQIDRLRQEHNRIFAQFVRKRIPLRGIWEKSLFGESDAFPQDVRLNEQKDVNSDEPKVNLVVLVHSVGKNKQDAMKIIRNATGLSLYETRNLVESQSPFTISVPESMASEIQSELMNAGATVTRQS